MNNDMIQISAELAERELARRSFIDYLSYTNGPTWKRTRFAPISVSKVVAL